MDKIYRNRINRRDCKEHEIRLSGSSFGRPRKDQSAVKKLEYIDNAERVGNLDSIIQIWHMYKKKEEYYVLGYIS